MKERTYIAIDLKSFYASVECVERGLDPLTTNLVVADESRTEKTICLAASPSMKAYGIPGRARLFEVVQKIREVNAQRRRACPNRFLSGESVSDIELKANPSLSVGYIAAPPRMAFYMEYSTRIYGIYQKYVSPDDIHVYSIDEVFIDATDYLTLYGLTARELTVRMIHNVLSTTGITATAGIGTNLYLCKIAMDIEAKHVKADKDGVRIAELDEKSYREKLWSHRPLTDFWRVGKGYDKKLRDCGLYTMGDIARQSVVDEEKLYKLFGINAELLIDHAWGWEPCTIADIKAYKPENSSISSGQVLSCPYPYEKARLIVKEMTDALALDLAEKGLVTDQIILDIGYDIIDADYGGETVTDRYGRKVPKGIHGSANLPRQSSSSTLAVEAALTVFDRLVNKKLSVRRIAVTAARVLPESEAESRDAPEQLSMFDDPEQLKRGDAEEKQAREKEKSIQTAVIGIKQKYGKNAILKGMNLEEGATAVQRNKQIGGHKA